MTDTEAPRSPGGQGPLAEVLPEMSGSFYFGCARGIGGRRDVGHYLYYPAGDGVMKEPRGYEEHVRAEAQIPWGGTPDGTLAPRQGEGRRAPEAPEGHAALHHKDGWTALSFWDRSGDSRGASNSNFFFNEILDFDQAIARAKSEFPGLFARFPFEIRPFNG